MFTYEMNAGYSVMDASLCMTVPAILDCFQDAAVLNRRMDALMSIIFTAGRLRGF